MPHLKISTTLPNEVFDDAFLKDLTTTVATLCGKPAEVFLNIV